MNRKAPKNKAAEIILGFLMDTGVSQRELAGELGLPNGSFGDYMRSRTIPPLAVAVKIEDYFDGMVLPRHWLEDCRY